MWLCRLHVGGKPGEPVLVRAVEWHEESLRQPKAKIGSHLFDAL